jgi:hypothetical protein
MLLLEFEAEGNPLLESLFSSGDHQNGAAFEFLFQIHHTRCWFLLLRKKYKRSSVHYGDIREAFTLCAKIRNFVSLFAGEMFIA